MPLQTSTHEGVSDGLVGQGHIGASQGGLSLLEDEYIIECIVEIAEDSPVYSLRGCVGWQCHPLSPIRSQLALFSTAFFVLGLIAATVEGTEILDDLGWESLSTPLGVATGICVPVEISSFVYVSRGQVTRANCS